MNFLKRIKDIIFRKHRKSSTFQIDESDINIINNNLTNPQNKNFVEKNSNQLTAKDVFPDLEVFQPRKTSKNPSIDEIQERLKNAKKSFPLPAAYRDALICMRKIIRAKKKAKEPYKKELKQLYRFACEYNFFESYPYLENVGEPSINLAEVIKKTEFSSLKMPYNEIGYKHIPELKKTDIKWLIAEFGEPANHTTVSQYHINYLKKMEGLLKEKRKREREQLWKF